MYKDIPPTCRHQMSRVTQTISWKLNSNLPDSIGGPTTVRWQDFKNSLQNLKYKKNPKEPNEQDLVIMSMGCSSLRWYVNKWNFKRIFFWACVHWIGANQWLTQYLLQKYNWSLSSQWCVSWAFLAPFTEYHQIEKTPRDLERLIDINIRFLAQKEIDLGDTIEIFANNLCNLYHSKVGCWYVSSFWWQKIITRWNIWEQMALRQIDKQSIFISFVYTFLMFFVAGLCVFK